MLHPCSHRFTAQAVALPVLHWRSHRASLAVSSGFLVSAGAVTGATDQAAPRRSYRPRRKPASEADQASTQTYLQSALGIDAAAALSLTLRTHRPSLLQLSTCQGWVTYLTQLAGGDASPALAILQTHPHVLDNAFDQQRQQDLDQLQHCLSSALGIDQQQLCRMATRQPNLLISSVSTVAAAAAFLLTQHGGDVAAARHPVLTNPQLLTSSFKLLQGTLQGGTARQLPTRAALSRLSALISRGISDDRCEQRSQWLLQQGFTGDQASRLSYGAVRLIGINTDVLQRRLDHLTHACGIPASSMAQMLAAKPALWTLNLHSHVMQLKLQYWQQELGYSTSDLPLAPVFLTISLVSSASRHSVLRDLLGSTPSPSAFLQWLIPGRVGASQRQFGPRVLAAYVEQHGGAGSSVQDLLQPLSARLSQVAHQEEWTAALQAHPRLPSAGRATPQHRQLYDALDAIAARDWPLSAHGQKWRAAAAAATAADRVAVVRQRDAAAAARALVRASRAQPGSAATAEATVPASTAPAASPPAGVSAAAQAASDGAPSVLPAGPPPPEGTSASAAVLQRRQLNKKRDAALGAVSAKTGAGPRKAGLRAPPVGTSELRR